MYAADEVYDTALLEQPWDDEPEPCNYPVEADISGEHVEIIRCGVPSVDLMQERCAEHRDMEPWAR